MSEQTKSNEISAWQFPPIQNQGVHSTRQAASQFTPAGQINPAKIAEATQASQQEVEAKIRDEYEAKWQAQQQQMQRLLTQLAQPLAEQEQALEESVLQIIKRLSAILIGRELSLNPDHFAKLIKASINKLSEAQATITCHIHPQDLILLKDIQGLPQNLTLVEDDSLSLGEWQLNTQHATLQANLAQSLDTIIQQVLNNGD